MAGWQQLFWDEQCVSQINASPDNELFSHSFSLQTEQGELRVELNGTLQWQPFELQYQLIVNEEVLHDNTLNEKDIEQRQVTQNNKQPVKFSLIGMAGLGLKLLKSAKIIKVLFAAGSLAAYSWLFSIEFAIALILCLVFHEYGHIKAMKYFGQTHALIEKTKCFSPHLAGPRTCHVDSRHRRAPSRRPCRPQRRASLE